MLPCRVQPNHRMPENTAPEIAAIDHTVWQALPRRSVLLAAASAALLWAVLIGLSTAAAVLINPPSAWLWWLIPLAALVAGSIGAWLGAVRQRRTLWRLDNHGLAVRRGRCWQSETRVPISRVQHLDLRHGPIERSARLATLMVHTAGTRLNIVTISGLDHGDAEHLRDQLSRQADYHDAL